MYINRKFYIVSASLYEIHSHKNGNLPLCDIGAKLGISVSYLEQIFRRLRYAGLVQSTRGPGGGYILAKPFEKISYGDISDALNWDGHFKQQTIADRLNIKTNVQLIESVIGDQFRRTSLASIQNYVIKEAS